MLTARQASNTNVRIFVIADDQEHAVKLPNTVYDNTLPRSLISKAKALDTHGPILSNAPTTLTDHTGKRHTSTSTISLRWYYDNGLQTFEETFYVVDKLPRPDSDGTEWDAMLRAGVDLTPEQSAPQALPYYAMPVDPKKEKELKEREARGLKKFEAEKEAQQKAIRDMVKQQQLKPR